MHLVFLMKTTLQYKLSAVCNELPNYCKGNKFNSVSCTYVLVSRSYGRQLCLGRRKLNAMAAYRQSTDVASFLLAPLVSPANRTNTRL